MRSDEDLALSLQQHDSSALQPLVERHHSALIGFLYRLTGGDRQLAEDLAQEAFLRVLRGIHQYRYPRRFKPWLYAIATNIARDHYKSADARHTLNMNEADNVNLPAEEPEEAVLQTDEEQHLIGALRTLPPHQRETVILRYYQELSLAEIAETLSIPIGTVKSRLAAGLRQLKTQLEQEKP